MSGELVSLVNTLPSHSPPRRITYNLVLRRTGPSSPSDKTETIFPLIADWVTDLYGCEFSPDGQQVLIRQGVPGDEISRYQMLLWDRKTRRLRHGPGWNAVVRYPTTDWSPDSRRFAYVEGGGATGEATYQPLSMVMQLGPIYLCVYDLSTGRSRRLARMPEGNSDFAWLSNDTLLYTLDSEKKTGLSIYENADIHKISWQGGPSRKLIGEGYGPEPSPSGRWIAFFGWPAGPQPENPATGAAPPVRTGLFLYDMHSRKRRLLRPLTQDDTPDLLRWSPDSRRLWGIQITYRNTHPDFSSSSDTKDYPGYGTGQIYEISVPSLTRRTIATLTTTDVRARDDPSAQFQLIGVSHDGRFLLVGINEIGQTTRDGSANEMSRRIVAVSLKDGSVQTVYTGASGADWRETTPITIPKRAGVLHVKAE